MREILLVVWAWDDLKKTRVDSWEGQVPKGLGFPCYTDSFGRERFVVGGRAGLGLFAVSFADGLAAPAAADRIGLS